MRAILEVPWGPSRGRKAILEPGASLVIGRTERASFVFEHDRKMSAAHCEVAWDGACARVHDCRGVPETIVGGEARTDGTLRHGGWIQVGDTVMTLHVEAYTPPRREAQVAWTNHSRRALDIVRGIEPIYAVLDAARDPRVLQILRESAQEARSLFDGMKGEALATVAPYVVGLPPGSRLLEQLVLEGWGRRWGIFLSSKESLVEIRRHLRRFLMVADDATRRRMYFRFYDPSVLRTFLACATVRQASELFLRIESFVFEDEDGVPRLVERPAFDMLGHAR